MEFQLESMPIIKKVTAISTIQSLLNTKPFSKASLAETHKLLIARLAHTRNVICNLSKGHSVS